MTRPASRLLKESDIESRRFGLGIARGVVTGDANPDQVLRDIVALRPDVAIFRCAAGDTRQIAALVAAGLAPLHADTLVYYRIALDAARGDGEDPDFDGAIAQATEEDGDALADIVRRGFRDYRNHYHANPLLPADAILEGYVEWALDYAIRPADGQQTWVYRADGHARGFATCRLRPDGSEVEIVLNATDPAWAGRGFYSSLLRFLVAHYRSSGFAALVISTQVWNYRVQRVWARTGLVIDHAWDTYHVNVPRSFLEADHPCP